MFSFLLGLFLGGLLTYKFLLLFYTISKKRKKINSKERAKIHAMTDGYCFYCNNKLDRHWECDHYISLKKGGDDSLENIVPSCRDCNRKKSTKSATKFCLEQGYTERCFYSDYGGKKCLRLNCKKH